MSGNYDKLIELLKGLKEQNRSFVLKVYLGDVVDGIYEFKVLGTKNDTMDWFGTDGNIKVVALDDKNNGYSVKDADYCFISTIEDGMEILNPVCKNVSLFILPDSFQEFTSELIEKDYELYLESFKRENFAGMIKDYSFEKREGLVIEPSNELLRDNNFVNQDIESRKRMRYNHCDRTMTWKD